MLFSYIFYILVRKMLFFVHFLYFPWKNIIVCIFYISSTICPCRPGNAITYTPVDRGTPLHLHPVDRGTSLHMPLTYSAYVTKASSDMTQSYTVVKSGRCCTPLSLAESPLVARLISRSITVIMLSKI